MEASQPLSDIHEDSFRDDVLAGLALPQKRIPCKWLYDERGSALFDEITELPEYYPTRAEREILERRAGEMAQRLGPRALLVEYGSGSSAKTRILLDALDDPAGYVPIDISREHLAASAAALRERYPRLEILPVCSDYTTPVTLPTPTGEVASRQFFFPGGTIGNFEPDEARRFLRRLADATDHHGGLLVGVDLKKDPEVLHAAYDDAAGVTAEFNLNLLDRINREIGADFDRTRFRHRAAWNASAGRMEMHLDSLVDQVVRVNGTAVAFRTGESIWTEDSYKYAVDEFAALAAESGFRSEQVWLDEAGRFSVHWLRAE